MSSIKEKHIIKLMTVPLAYHKEITVVRGKICRFPLVIKKEILTFFRSISLKNKDIMAVLTV